MHPHLEAVDEQEMTKWKTTSILKSWMIPIFSVQLVLSEEQFHTCNIEHITGKLTDKVYWIRWNLFPALTENGRKLSAFLVNFSFCCPQLHDSSYLQIVAQFGMWVFSFFY